MADSIAEQIIDAMVVRLQAITVAGGYNTTPDVSRNRPALDGGNDDELPALVVREQQESSQQLTSGGQVDNRLLLIVECWTRGTLSQLVADVKKAAFDPTDRQLGGLSHNVLYEGWERVDDEVGTEITGAELELTVEYREQYGDPYTI